AAYRWLFYENLYQLNFGLGGLTTYIQGSFPISFMVTRPPGIPQQIQRAYDWADFAHWGMPGFMPYRIKKYMEGGYAANVVDLFMQRVRMSKNYALSQRLIDLVRLALSAARAQVLKEEAPEAHRLARAKQIDALWQKLREALIFSGKA